MKDQATLKKIEDLVSPVLLNLGYELVEREFAMDSGRLILRLYIDKEGGVTIDDCSRASRALEDLIEVEGAVSSSYILEVSSPGIERPLRRKKDFERFVGSTIKLKTVNPIDGRSNYRGILKGTRGEDIVVLVDGVEYSVPIVELHKARLIAEF